MRVRTKTQYSWLCVLREISKLERIKNKKRRTIRPYWRAKKSPGGGMRGFRKRELKRIHNEN